MTTRANMLSRFENFAEIDPDGVVDAWGIPVLKIHIQHSDNERAMAQHAAECSEEILRAAGAEVLSTGGTMTAPGRIIHELGTARMGNDPKTSVLNKWNQVHDVKNVFVTDGAAFVGACNQNPTITIMALTMRACDYIEDERKRGNFKYRRELCLHKTTHHPPKLPLVQNLRSNSIPSLLCKMGGNSRANLPLPKPATLSRSHPRLPKLIRASLHW